MAGRTPGRTRRRTGFAVMTAGIVLVMAAAYDIAVPGDVRLGMVAVFTALPVGSLLLLAGADLRSRSTHAARCRWSGVVLDEWLTTAQSRSYAAKAAFN